MKIKENNLLLQYLHSGLPVWGIRETTMFNEFGYPRTIFSLIYSLIIKTLFYVIIPLHTFIVILCSIRKDSFLKSLYDDFSLASLRVGLFFCNFIAWPIGFSCFSNYFLFMHPHYLIYTYFVSGSVIFLGLASFVVICVGIVKSYKWISKRKIIKKLADKVYQMGVIEYK